MKELNDKIKGFFSTWKENKEKKSREKFRKRINDIDMEIRTEMPFLAAQELSLPGYPRLSKAEQFKAYYEIKGIQRQHLSNIAIIVLTLAVIILTGLQVYLEFFAK